MKSKIELLQKFSIIILSLVLTLSLFRLSRIWNSTGDKWKHLPDLEDTIRQQKAFIRQGLVTTGLVLMMIVIRVCPIFTIVTLVRELFHTTSSSGAGFSKVSLTSS